MNNIEKTLKFLEETYDNSEYFSKDPLHKQYRLEHTYRVANIGKHIAEKEGLHVEGVVVGCLLHDIGYAPGFDEHEQRAHGRMSARMSRDFVNALDLPENVKEEMLYGIAIHVDGKSDFEGEATVLADTISECDNIDRFDKFRLYEALKWSDLYDKSLDEQREFAKQKVERLNSLKETYVFRTKTSNDLWNEKLDYQIEYFELLLKQLDSDRTKLI